MSVEEEEEVRLEAIKSRIAEHYYNFVFVVITDEKELYYDYADRFTGKSLLESAIEDMTAELDLGDVEFSETWDEDDDNEGEEWKDA